jgi:hypothetical protein
MSLLTMVFAAYLAHAAACHLHDSLTLASALGSSGGLPAPASSPHSTRPNRGTRADGVGAGLGAGAPVQVVDLDAAEANTVVDVEAQLPVVAGSEQFAPSTPLRSGWLSLRAVIDVGASTLPPCCVTVLALPRLLLQTDDPGSAINLQALLHVRHPTCRILSVRAWC